MRPLAASSASASQEVLRLHRNSCRQCTGLIVAEQILRGWVN